MSVLEYFLPEVEAQSEAMPSPGARWCGHPYVRPSAPHREGGRTDGFISALRSRRLRYGTVKERKNWEGRFVGTIHAVNQPLLNKPYLLLSGYGGGCGTFTGFFVMAALISAIARLS